MNGRVVLVAGASSKIAPVTALRLAGQGAIPVLHYFKNEKKVKRLQSEIEEGGGQCRLIQADLSDKTAPEEMIDEIWKEEGRIDGLVNFVFPDEAFRPVPIADSSWETDYLPMVSAFAIHFLLCRAVIPYMREQGYGRIVYLSGALSRKPMRGCAAYMAAKCAAEAFCKVLATEEAPRGITCNIVSPGAVDPQDGLLYESSRVWSAIEPNKISSIPTGRIASPADVAEAVLFFLLPANRQLTGQTLFVAGGECMP